MCDRDAGYFEEIDGDEEEDETNKNVVPSSEQYKDSTFMRLLKMPAAEVALAFTVGALLIKGPISLSF